MKKQKQNVVKNHLKAEGTRKAYDSQIKRGREFLEQQCKDGQAGIPAQPSGGVAIIVNLYCGDILIID